MRLLPLLLSLLLLLPCLPAAAGAMPVDLTALQAPDGAYTYAGLPWGLPEADVLAALPFDFDTVRHTEDDNNGVLHASPGSAMLLGHPAAVQVALNDGHLASLAFFCTQKDNPGADLATLHAEIAAELEAQYGPPVVRRSADGFPMASLLWRSAPEGAAMTSLQLLYAEESDPQAGPVVVLILGTDVPREGGGAE